MFKKKKKRFFPIKSIFKFIFLAIILFLIILFFRMGRLIIFIPNLFSIIGGEKHYLVLLQNNNELRASGGFITAYADLYFKNGLIKKLDIKDSYSISGHKYIEPPYPLGELLADPWYQGHTFRDANFSPHFPRSAENAVGFYKLIFPNDKFDGVFAANFSVIEKLIERFGPIKINGNFYNSKTLFKDLEFEVKNIDRHSEEDLTSRKDVFKILAKKLIRKIVFHPFVSAKIVNKALKEKDIQLYFKDEKLAKEVSYYNFGGEFKEKEGSDFIGIIESNFGGKKADRYLKRNIEYIVNLREGDTIEGELKITLTHFGEINEYSDRFKGYLQVFLSKDANLKKYPEESKIEKGDFIMIGKKLFIEPDETKTFVYKFNISPYAYKNGKYNLHIHKQSGAQDFYRVIVKSPTGTDILSKDFTAKENRAFFETILDTDKNLSLEIKPDNSPPLIIEQRFESMDEISISFSEILNPLSASDIQNYVIFDKNIKDKKEDKIKIEKARVSDKTVFLTISGVTDQPLERYLLRLSNIQDKSGNTITPNPKEITVVQRFLEE